MHGTPGTAHLGPVGEDLAVAAVGDQLLRELRHAVVQVVHDHQDDGDRLARDSRVQPQGVRPVGQATRWGTYPQVGGRRRPNV